MDQFIGGIPVLYGAVSVGVDDATGLVNVLGATFLPDRGLPRQPKISEAEAAKLAEQYLVKFVIAKPGSVKTSTPTLAYMGTHPDSTRGHLVWAVPASYTPEGAGITSGIFWFDAIDGALVGQDALSRGAALNVYTGNNNLNVSDYGLTSALVEVPLSSVRLEPVEGLLTDVRRLARLVGEFSCYYATSPQLLAYSLD